MLYFKWNQWHSLNGSQLGKLVQGDKVRDDD